MTDKLSELLARIEDLGKKASPAPWPKYFARVDDSDEGCVATGPTIRCDDADIEEDQAQADQDFVVISRSVILPLVDVVKAAASIRGSCSYKLNNALAKLAEVDCP